jgi:hypothetical protein
MLNPRTHPATRIPALALFGLAAFTATACRGTEPALAAAPASNLASAATPAPTPVAVNCGAGQQALIRPGVVAGQAISQVDCVALPGAAAYAPAAAGVISLDDDPRLGAPAYRVAAQPVGYRTVQYRRAPVRQPQRGRSVKKSALIIGSSAGIGAGVGAAVQGKKGALIGAAIGGGAATIWDQVTRRDPH